MDVWTAADAFAAVLVIAALIRAGVEWAKRVFKLRSDSGREANDWQEGADEF